MTVQSSSLHHILVSVNDGIHPSWDFCGLYGWSRTEEHVLTWDLMRSFTPYVQESWICAGDFNETMFHFEKRRGNLKADERLMDFRETVDLCGLSDLSFMGDPFTWSNNQQGVDNIMERLDRALGSATWAAMFPGYEVSHLLRKSSDHCPILLNLDKDLREIQNRPKPFHFEAMWLKDDRCLPFCANLWNSAEGRKKRNYIREIQKADGTTVRANDELDEVFWSHFQTLFTSGSTHNPAEVLQSIEPVVTTEMNRNLTAPYTQTEIEQVLNQMHPLKAPRPDGMPALFYKSCWYAAKFDLVHMILDVLNNGVSPGPINSTFICLIPKKKKCVLPSDFRRISLCNVVDKIISKAITNRLKLCLPSIIHESQSAFVPGRHITDNALLAFEIFHILKLNKAKAHGIFAFKLDMAKAYDRVKWGFLESIMLHLGASFEPSRGLRQGDPLSPFLFLFCAEALSGLLRKAETNNLLHGARICRTAPRVSHILFADDCIIFGCGNSMEVSVVSGIIKTYEGVSGQLVNLDKSIIDFSGGIDDNMQQQLAEQLGVQRSGQRSTYLGIPNSVGRAKNEIFQMLVDRTRKKSKDWKMRFLSGASKMLNSVVPRFFWGQKTMKGAFTREVGRGYVWRKERVDLDSEILVSLTKLCWPNKLGGYLHMTVHFLPDL
ncbi:uncharacterized protein LOC131018874 [Salvia miltiorrhiza]|uniref:uncharacterized protein LOC131018874 n=1 Tax=Salvia miltiorrhiza TaxID=226208 RepID=UPI0025ABE507|nr:uncharacterized protein LOC131018874 [Salvia miltiorrhiza]